MPSRSYRRAFASPDRLGNTASGSGAPSRRYAARSSTRASKTRADRRRRRRRSHEQLRRRRCVEPRRVRLNDLVAEQAAAERAREQLHHHGEGRRPCGRPSAGGCARPGSPPRRLSGALLVEPPTGRNQPGLFAPGRRHPAEREPGSSRMVEDNGPAASALGAPRLRGVVAQQRPRRIPARACSGSRWWCRCRCSLRRRPGTRTRARAPSASSRSPGQAPMRTGRARHGRAHPLNAHVTARPPIAVQHAGGRRIADHADARVGLCLSVPEPERRRGSIRQPCDGTPCSSASVISSALDVADVRRHALAREGVAQGAADGARADSPVFHATWSSGRWACGPARGWKNRPAPSRRRA